MKDKKDSILLWLPAILKAKLKIRAYKNMRSMTKEITAILQKELK